MPLCHSEALFCTVVPGDDGMVERGYWRIGSRSLELVSLGL